VEFKTEAQILDYDYNHTGERWQSTWIRLHASSEQRKPACREISKDVRAAREISRFQSDWRTLVGTPIALVAGSHDSEKMCPSNYLTSRFRERAWLESCCPASRCWWNGQLMGDSEPRFDFGPQSPGYWIIRIKGRKPLPTKIAKW